MPALTTKQSVINAKAPDALVNPGVFLWGFTSLGDTMIPATGGVQDTIGFGEGGRFVRASFQNLATIAAPSDFTLTLSRIVLPAFTVIPIFSVTFPVSIIGESRFVSPEPEEPRAVFLPTDLLRWTYSFAAPPAVASFLLRPYYQLNGV